MPKQMPESHQTHVYDKRARRNLEDNFPEHWKLNPAREYHSGIEYGDDWICQLTDDRNRLVGARFYIQSKTTEKKIGKRRIGMPIKVSTLNFLALLYLFYFTTITSRQRQAIGCGLMITIKESTSRNGIKSQTRK